MRLHGATSQKTELLVGETILLKMYSVNLETRSSLKTSTPALKSFFDVIYETHVFVAAFFVNGINFL
jgi:hypothetical protein